MQQLAAAARAVNSALGPKMRRLLLETLVPVGAMAVLISAGLWLRAGDLAMFGTLAPLPLFLLIFVRRQLTLPRKLKYAGPIPVVLPALLFVVWVAQFPGRPMYFFVAAVAGAVFLAGVFACTRMLWEVR